MGVHVISYKLKSFLSWNFSTNHSSSRPTDFFKQNVNAIIRSNFGLLSYDKSAVFYGNINLYEVANTLNIPLLSTYMYFSDFHTMPHSSTIKNHHSRIGLTFFDEYNFLPLRDIAKFPQSSQSKGKKPCSKSYKNDAQRTKRSSGGKHGILQVYTRDCKTRHKAGV